MASYNRVILAGNLTRDPEYKQLTSGQGVCRLGLAVNRQFRNRQTGDMVKEVCYIDIDVWGAQADNCRQYLKKGSPVLIEGRLKFDTWETDGQTRSKHSIVADNVIFLSSGPGAAVEVEGVEQMAPPSLEALQKAVKTATLDMPRPATGKKRANEGTIALGDEPAFQDDLPF